MHSVRKPIIFFALFSLFFATNFPITNSFAASSPLQIVQEAISLPEAKAGVAYEYQFQSEGGLAPLTWRVTEGNLPPGLTLESSGILHGVPAQALRDGYAFVVEVSDSSRTPQRATMPYLLMVEAAPLRIIATPKLSITQPSTMPSERSGNAPGRPSPVLKANDASPTITDNVRASINVTGNNAASDPRAAAPADTTTTTITVCGKVQLASLNRTLAWIREANLPDKVIDYDPKGGSKLKPKFVEEEKENIRGRFVNEINANWGRVLTDILEEGKWDNQCNPMSGNIPGQQKAAAVNMLRDALLAMQDKRMKPSDFFKGYKSARASGGLSTQMSPAKGLKSPGEKEFSSLSAETIQRQIMMLQQYLGGIRVMITTSDGTWKAEGSADIDGNYKLKFDAAAGEEYIVTTDADDFYTKVKFRSAGSAEPPVKIDIHIEDRPVSLLTRAVAGMQQAGAASAERNFNVFFDLFISKTLPWRQTIHPDFGESWRVWAATRFLSAPQSGEATIGTSVNGFATTVTGLKVKDAVRVFDFLGGIEARLFGNSALLPSFDRQTKQKFSLSFIASLGFTTPDDQRLNIFKFNVPNDPSNLPAEIKVAIKDKNFVAFVPFDRDRFFRQYYAGLRMQTFFFNQHNIPLQRFPAQFDFTVGQNEYVTGGLLRGPIFRVDSYFPLPYDGLKFINLYGTAFLRPAHVKTGTPLLLQPVDGNPQTNFVPDKNTGLVPVRQFDRDYYKIGVGIDFLSLLQMIRNRQPVTQ